MKTFKALYIDNGIIKAGEFPVEPDSCFLPFCETDGTDIEYCKCHELETEYERAMREAKANAVEVSNPDELSRIGVDSSELCEGEIVPLPENYTLITTYDNKVALFHIMSTRTASRHGWYETREYVSWGKMKQRCFNTHFNQYDNYGGRGITMCDRWVNSFENFIADMGRAPSKVHTIDRIDSDGPYSPENCRWATPSMQQNNKRTCIMITYRGKTQSLKNWCKELNVNYHMAQDRITKRRWDPIAALTIPKLQSKSDPRRYEAQ